MDRTSSVLGRVRRVFSRNRRENIPNYAELHSLTFKILENEWKNLFKLIVELSR